MVPYPCACGADRNPQGGILMFRPGQGTRALMVMFGISLLSEGILNFSTALTAVKIVRNQVPDVVDVEFHE